MQGRVGRPIVRWHLSLVGFLCCKCATVLLLYLVHFGELLSVVMYLPGLGQAWRSTMLTMQGHSHCVSVFVCPLSDVVIHTSA